MTAEPFTSPLALLNQWRDREDGADLHELLLLGFTVDLPFLEKVAIPMARAMGARVTVVGDAAQGRYDPVDVRLAGRSYFHALASCDGAFHPKLALLIGADDAVAAIGSGNPTMAGWGYNDELWTVLRGRRDSGPAALGQLAEWLQLLPIGVAVPEYVDTILQEIAATLEPFGGPASEDVQVIHNLDTGLLEQLPSGPVEELSLYAPFLDPSGNALAQIIDRFAPERLTIGLQEHQTSYDGDVLLRAAADSGRKAEIRLLPERFPRHGKLLEWTAAGHRWTLTGSANLTASALLRATGAGGNCELAILAPSAQTLMPPGEPCPAPRLEGRRTVRATEPRPGLTLLGALVTAQGVQVTLARAYDVEITVETSLDGSPGSWQRAGVIPAGATGGLFAVPEIGGTVVRAVAGPLLSPPVFAAQPARCARRREDDHRPRLRHPYSEEEIFTDPELARRFRLDLLRLMDGLTSVTPATTTPHASTGNTVQDRWTAWLDDCERTFGRPLTSKLFNRPVAASPTAPGWNLTTSITLDADADEPTPEDETPRTPPTPDERASWQRWASRAVAAVEGGAPLMTRVLIARLFVQLLGHGVWTMDDPSWRPDLAALTRHLPARPEDDAPPESLEHIAVLTAVCMGLLHDGASLAGGTPEAEVWAEVRATITDARPDLAGDLLIPPLFPHARVLSRTQLEGLVQLAADDDPVVHIAADLAETGWDLSEEDGLFRVDGSFTNPVPVAARVATLLGEHRDIALVHAVSGNRWAFVAWRRPDLVLASFPAGNAWRLYRLSGLATPQARLGSGEGITRIDMVGNPVRIGQVPPEAARRLLTDAGTDHLEILGRLTSAVR
ncbi:hypothetical protein [Actinomadura hibisca]|uniref:hypothetical protein n=1 Tax=Actinomadura hibisca TaxID=68565 RepID=UPI00082960FD|nr:hypothetical protein [Actinomadura hibisca]